MRQQLGAVGIDVDPRPLEPAVFAPTVFKDRSFDTNVISYCNGPGPGDRRAAHVPLLADRPGAVHERRRLPQRARGRAVRRGGPDGRARTRAASSTARSRRSLVQELPYCLAGGDARPRAPGRRGAAASRRGQGSSPRRPPVSDSAAVSRPLPAAAACAGRARRRRHRARLAFIVIHTAPGDPVLALAGEHGDAALLCVHPRQKFGLDRPLPEQFLVYARNVIARRPRGVLRPRPARAA